jgi:hypothetical protein
MNKEPKIGQRVYNPHHQVECHGRVQGITKVGKIRVLYDDDKVRLSWMSALRTKKPPPKKPKAPPKKRGPKKNHVFVMLALDEATRDRVLQHMFCLDLTAEQVLDEMELL